MYKTHRKEKLKEDDNSSSLTLLDITRLPLFQSIKQGLRKDNKATLESETVDKVLQDLKQRFMRLEETSLER